MSRKGLSLLTALWLTMSLPGAANAEVGVTDKQVTIGTCNALTGNNEFSGKQTTVGIKTYFNALNAKGGVYGRKVQVLTCDDRYERDGAYACFQKM